VPQESRRELAQVHQGRKSRDRGRENRAAAALPRLGHGHRHSGDKIGDLFTEFKQTDATIASEYGGNRARPLDQAAKFIESMAAASGSKASRARARRSCFEIPLRVVSP
jgi:hypothetical protein